MNPTTYLPRPLAVVANDDALIRLAMADILEDAGYTPMEAHHADHALSILQNYHPVVHVLITDVRMHGGSRDGFALARETAANWPHIAVVVSSGQMQPQPGDLPAGAVFIAKPFRSELVRQHLREIMDNAGQGDPMKL